MNPEHFELLCKNHAPELLRGYLLDCAAASGLDTADLQITLSKGSSRWDEFPPALVDQLFQLGKGALHDADFAALLADLEPLALKLQAAKVDSKELSRLKRGVLYQFPQPKNLAVAEPPPKKTTPDGGPRPTPPVPHPGSAG